ncbi:hypothetical protein BX661DRAFT_199329 [Kickxella alabastrina]|uniref:uncharacterized protein n=1 Tax=Kickxella alabastrina TaxID=61397 RepID=UPI00221F6E59|nr:uncharacterized protein BX661DRAFT_199329 [Kickxella alabastrina]KAI7825502.1 hypothetical protein BX661DRAFT_199329 [Kickxella alabastrina]
MPSCDGIRDEYIHAFYVHKKQGSAHLVPEQCKMLGKSLFECKRGLLDMRKRMRGVPNAGRSSGGVVDPQVSTLMYVT